MEKTFKFNDNLDFKILKDYGFFQNNKYRNSWSYELAFDDDSNFSDEPYGYIEVAEFETDGKTPTNRIFDITIIQDDETHYYIPGIIYDLIKDNLIQVVEVEPQKGENFSE